MCELRLRATCRDLRTRADLLARLDRRRTGRFLDQQTGDRRAISRRAGRPQGGARGLDERRAQTGAVRAHHHLDRDDRRIRLSATGDILHLSEFLDLAWLAGGFGSSGAWRAHHDFPADRDAGGWRVPAWRDVMDERFYDDLRCLAITDLREDRPTPVRQFARILLCDLDRLCYLVRAGVHGDGTAHLHRRARP